MSACVGDVVDALSSDVAPSCSLESCRRDSQQCFCAFGLESRPWLVSMTVTKERFLLIRCTALGGHALPTSGQVLQSGIRESVQESFGDFGVGSILLLFQGARAPLNSPATHA